jgi:malonyl-CoA/methylmalonyl-CoA synthetase
MMANLLASLGLPEGRARGGAGRKVGRSHDAVPGDAARRLCVLPLNTAYQSAEIEYFIGNAEPSVVVCSSKNFGWVSKIAFKAGTQNVFTLDDDRTGSLLDRAAHCSDSTRPWRARPTTWPPSSTPAAPPAAARAPC